MSSGWQSWFQKGGKGARPGKPAAATPSAPATEFKVSCKVANVNGKYKLKGDNHDRGTYEMYESDLKDIELTDMPVIYYWDDRDGRDSQGWWIGVGVGGAQVWAYVKKNFF